MNRVYEFAIRLKDLVSPTLARVSGQYSGTVSRMQGLTNRFTSMFRGASQSVDELRKKLDGLKGRRDLMVDTRQIRAANREIGQLEARMNKLQGKGSSSGGGGLMGMARSALPVLGIAGLLAGAGDLANSGMNREQTKVAFEQFVGKAGVDPMMRQLNKFADVTPYDNEQVYGAGRTLLSAKVGPEELNQKMTNIGNMSAVSQKDFGEMAASYAKIKQKGFADSGELHMEFGGTAVMDQLKKNLNVNGEALFKMAEKRQIRFEDIDKAIGDLSAKGGLYEGGLDKLSQTAGGKKSTFLGTLQNKVTEMAEKMNPMLGKLFDFGTALIGKIDPVMSILADGFGKLWDATAPLRELFSNLFAIVGNLFSQFGGLAGGGKALTVVFDVLAAVVWTISKAIQIVGDIVLWLADSVIVKTIAVVFGLVRAWGFLNGVMALNPITAIVVGIMAMVAAIKYAWDHVDGFRYAIMKMWEVAKAVFGSLGTAWEALKNGDFAGLKNALKDGWAEGLANADRAIDADRKARAGAKTGAKPGAVGAGAGTAKAGAGGKAGGTVGDKAGVSATTGGTKSTTITINLGSLLTGGVTINAMGVSDGLYDLEGKLTDALLRVLNSSNALAT